MTDLQFSIKTIKLEQGNSFQPYLMIEVLFQYYNQAPPTEESHVELMNIKGILSVKNTNSSLHEVCIVEQQRSTDIMSITGGTIIMKGI